MMYDTSFQGKTALDFRGLGLDDEVLVVISTTVKKIEQASMDTKGHVDGLKLKVTGAMPLKGAEATKYKKAIAATAEKENDKRIQDALADSDAD